MTIVRSGLQIVLTDIQSIVMLEVLSWRGRWCIANKLTRRMSTRKCRRHMQGNWTYHLLAYIVLDHKVCMIRCLARCCMIRQGNLGIVYCLRFSSNFQADTAAAVQHLRRAHKSLQKQGYRQSVQYQEHMYQLSTECSMLTLCLCRLKHMCLWDMQCMMMTQEHWSRYQACMDCS